MGLLAYSFDFNPYWLILFHLVQVVVGLFLLPARYRGKNIQHDWFAAAGTPRSRGPVPIETSTYCFPPHTGERAQNDLACIRTYKLGQYHTANQTRAWARLMHASSLDASGRRTNHAHWLCMPVFIYIKWVLLNLEHVIFPFYTIICKGNTSN